MDEAVCGLLVAAIPLGFIYFSLAMIELGNICSTLKDIKSLLKQLKEK